MKTNWDLRGNVMIIANGKEYFLHIEDPQNYDLFKFAEHFFLEINYHLNYNEAGSYTITEINYDYDNNIGPIIGIESFDPRIILDDKLVLATPLQLTVNDFVILFPASDLQIVFFPIIGKVNLSTNWYLISNLSSQLASKSFIVYPLYVDLTLAISPIAVLIFFVAIFNILFCIEVCLAFVIWLGRVISIYFLRDGFL